MTLKEMVELIEPECVSENYAGGVTGCPQNYGYLDEEGLCKGSGDSTRCEECWSREFRRAEFVRQGEWKINCDGYYPYCSICENEPTARRMTRYCDHCGAKMDEEIE